MIIAITYVVTCTETLKEYADVHPEFILDDFLNNFEAWKTLGAFKVEVCK